MHDVHDVLWGSMHACTAYQWEGRARARRGRANTLEEAEDRMSRRDRVVFPVGNPRLAALAARGAPPGRLIRSFSLIHYMAWTAPGLQPRRSELLLLRACLESHASAVSAGRQLASTCWHMSAGWGCSVTSKVCLQAVQQACLDLLQTGFEPSGNQHGHCV